MQRSMSAPFSRTKLNGTIDRKVMLQREVASLRDTIQEMRAMSRNDLMEDLQEYMDDLESDLHGALEREEMWKEQCRALKQELLEVKGMLASGV